MATKKTSKTAATKATKGKPAAKPAKAPAAKTLYRVSEANEGRQLVGDFPTADTATKKAQAHMAKHGVPVEVARGKVIGSTFKAEFTEVLQPEVTGANEASSTTAIAAEAPVEVAPVAVEPEAAPVPAEPAAAPVTDNAATSEPIATATVDPAPATTPTSEPAAAKPKRTRKPKAPAADKKMSALDAAAKVLTEAGQPMSTPDMITAMAAKNYWASPNGKTPHATLYAAILREINTKGTAARFTKTDRGRFAAK